MSSTEPPLKNRCLEATPPDGAAAWEPPKPNSEAALAHGIPHEVVPQLVLPDVAAFAPSDSVAIRTLHDAQCCTAELQISRTYWKYYRDYSNPHVSRSPTEKEKKESFMFVVDADGKLEFPDVWSNHVTTETVEYAAQFPHLTGLNFRDSSVGAAELAVVAVRFPELRELCLRECDKLNESVSEVAKLSNLRVLDLSQTKFIETESWSCISTTLLELTHLNLGHCFDVMDTETEPRECLSHIANLPKLRHLDLSGCHDLEDGACHFARFRQLQCLILDFCQVGARMLAEISKIPELRTLSLHDSKVNARGLGALGDGVPKLQRLTMRSVWGINAAGLASVAKLMNLEHLDLSDSRTVDAEGLCHIATLPRLRFLRLTNCRRIGVAELTEIGRMKELRKLALSGCSQVDAEALARITTLPELEQLSLSGVAGVTAAGLASVAELHSLEVLDVSSCQGVDAEGLAHVARLPRLWHLNLHACAKVDAQGLEALLRLPCLRDLNVHDTRFEKQVRAQRRRENGDDDDDDGEEEEEEEEREQEYAESEEYDDDEEEEEEYYEPSYEEYRRLTGSHSSLSSTSH